MAKLEVSITVRPKLVFKLQTATIALLVLLSTAAAATQYWFGFDPDHPYFETVRLFWLDTEANVPTIFQVFALCACAIALFWLSRPTTGIAAPMRTRLKVLAAAFLVLAIDEGAHVHELIGLYVDTFLLDGSLSGSWLFNGTASWILAALIPGFALLLFIRPLLSYLPQRTRMLSVASAVLFLSGAVVVEKIGRLYALNVGSQTVGYGALATLEEALEMFGAAVFLYALLDYLATIRGSAGVSSSLPDSAS